MESTAKATFVRIAPRKVQIVLDLIRNQQADKAMAILKHTPKAACEPLMKLLKSAQIFRRICKSSALYMALCVFRFPDDASFQVI